jgi:hypothetical protein
MSDKITVVITARGEGSRMKAISPRPKHLLYYGGKRIIDHIKEAFAPFCEIEILEGKPTKNRAETLELLRGRKNVLICDCDVIPVFAKPTFISDFKDFFDWLPSQPLDYIFCFASGSPKYCGLRFDFSDGGTELLTAATEREDASKRILRASGLYFLKDVGGTIDRMTDPNSIASGMIGAKSIPEQTFIRLGDPDDYLNELK